MWPFHKFSTAFPQDLQGRLDTVESQIRLLKAEWEEMYDKIVRRMERERKRRAVEIDEKPVENEQNSIPLKSDMNHEQIMSLARQKGYIR